MGSERSGTSDLRRFVFAIAGSALFFLVLGRVAGEHIALWLQSTPTTNNGWLFLGWLIGGPPFVVAALVWIDRKQLRPRQLLGWTWATAIWGGAGMFILPARVIGISAQFGTGAIVGNPLCAGWVWGMLANVVMLVFGGLVLMVLRSATASGGVTQAQRTMTIRFLEQAWLVALVVTLGLALYGGNGSGIFNNGT
ncbi:MAG: hypothetical protein JWP74_1113 [Marmoricola sp.]|nr:hypothetical protein [Marmoricola sp.]